MKIKIINHKDTNGTLVFLDETYLKIGEGALRDKDRKDDREISILSYSAYQKIVDGKMAGLCTSKFYSNLIVEDFQFEDLKIGDIWQIRNAKIEITKIGKSCYKECDLNGKSEYCPLLRGVAFGRVISEDLININDKISLSKKS